MKTLPREEVEKLLQQYAAEHHLPADLSRLSDATDEVIETLRHGRQHIGEPMPWQKTDDFFRFRPRELTVWAGYNGHGKTLCLSDIMANSVTYHGTTWALASFEMPLARLAERFVIQCSGSQRPSEKYIRHCLGWTDDKIWVFDELDSVTPDRVYAFVRMAFDHLKADHVVIDSLVKCGVNSRENEPQKSFVDQLQHIAKHANGHIHLVHHLRKGDDELTIPNKQDLKGAGEIADLADNVILVHRNKRKEQAVIDDTADPSDPDARLIVEKQRHYDWTGSIRLWYEPESLRYLGTHGERRKWYGPSLDDVRSMA